MDNQKRIEEEDFINFTFEVFFVDFQRLCFLHSKNESKQLYIVDHIKNKHGDFILSVNSTPYDFITDITNEVIFVVEKFKGMMDDIDDLLSLGNEYYDFIRKKTESIFSNQFKVWEYYKEIDEKEGVFK